MKRISRLYDPYLDNSVPQSIHDPKEIEIQSSHVSVFSPKQPAAVRYKELQTNFQMGKAPSQNKFYVHKQQRSLKMQQSQASIGTDLDGVTNNGGKNPQICESSVVSTERISPSNELDNLRISPQQSSKKVQEISKMENYNSPGKSKKKHLNENKQNNGKKTVTILEPTNAMDAGDDIDKGSEV